MSYEQNVAFFCKCPWHKVVMGNEKMTMEMLSKEKEFSSECQSERGHLYY